MASLTNNHIDYSRCTPGILDRFWAKVDRSGSCWEWKGARLPSGYGQFGLYRGRVMLAHRFIDIAFNGDSDEDFLVMHTCDNPSCVRPSHLRRGTPKENMDDMRSKGRARLADYSKIRGDKHYAAKLNQSQVDEIRSLCVPGQSKTIIAERFGISLSHVYKIIHGGSWSENERGD